MNVSAKDVRPGQVIRISGQEPQTVAAVLIKPTMITLALLPSIDFIQRRPDSLVRVVG